MTTESNQSTDRTSDQQYAGENQLYVVKSGEITIATSDFATVSGGKEAVVATQVFNYPSNPSVSKAFLLQNCDVFHYINDESTNEMDWDVDALITKCGYATRDRYCSIDYGYRSFVNTFNIYVTIRYFTSSASGKPYSYDTAQTFYYFVYSMKGTTS